MMRVIGIDPGSRYTGYGVIMMLRNGKINHIDSGYIKLQKTESLAQRLKTIFSELSTIIQAHQPHTMAVEKVFMAHNADSALKLGQARGAAICAAVHQHLDVSEYTALQIKRSIVGSGRAEKKQVQHMVRALLGLEKTPQEDTADALACAICHAHHQTRLHALQRNLAINKKSIEKTL